MKGGGTPTAYFSWYKIPSFSGIDLSLMTYVFYLLVSYFCQEVQKGTENLGVGKNLGSIIRAKLFTTSDFSLRV